MRGIRKSLLLAMVFCVAGCAQSTQEVPNEVAFRALFAIMRTAPPPHWDFATKLAWLAPVGITPREALQLQTAADQYWQEIAPLETQLKSIHVRFVGRNASPEAANEARPVRDAITAAYQRRTVELAEQFGASAFEKVTRKIQLMKREFKAPGAEIQSGHSHPH